MIADMQKRSLLIKEHGVHTKNSKIYDFDMKLMESIFMRSEDAIPSLDSIKGKDVYISYQNLPSNDSILGHDRCVLGESLWNKDKLKYNYHFRSIR